MELLDSLRAGCAGLIPGVETCDVQSRIYDLHRAGDAAAADAAFKEVLPLLHFLMSSIDHLMCYVKRLAARRIGFGEVHDRVPAHRPHPDGLRVREHRPRDLRRLVPSDRKSTSLNTSH